MIKKIILLLLIALVISGYFLANNRQKIFASISHDTNEADVLKKMGNPDVIGECHLSEEGALIPMKNTSQAHKPICKNEYWYRSFNPFDLETMSIVFDAEGKAIAKYHYFPEVAL